MKHPAAIARQITIALAATKPLSAASLPAREASRALYGARYHLRRLYGPIHAYGDAPARIQHWLQVGKPTHMRWAKAALRNAQNYLIKGDVA